MRPTAFASSLLLAASVFAKPDPAWVNFPHLYEPLEDHELLSAPHLAESPLEPISCQEAGVKPRLKKFAQNIIWEVVFSESAVYDYIQAFYTGFQFDKYSNGEQCFENSVWSMDVLYNMRMEVIRRTDWGDPLTYMFLQIATVIDESWYNCVLFTWDFIDAFVEKKNGFVDAPDIYLSFIFNLLGNSFQVKEATEAMIAAASTYDTVTLMQQSGYLLNIMYDFESYKATQASLASFIKQAAIEHNEVKGATPKAERQRLRAQQSEEARARVERKKHALTQNRDREVAEDKYKWTAVSYIQIPFAFILGGLNALGGQSHASYCSRYTLSAREELFQSVPYFEEDATLDGLTEIFQSLRFFDNIGYSCEKAIKNELDEDWYEQYT